jgi:hypothetical protein
MKIGPGKLLAAFEIGQILDVFQGTSACNYLLAGKKLKSLDWR